MALMSLAETDSRWMRAALALAQRGVGLSTPNPSVGCIILKGGIVIGRGWTQPGGRPHAEAMALAQAGEAARGATAYVTLEPCAHTSPRGPACADALIDAAIAKVVVAMTDPDPRTAGNGLERLRAAGVEVVTGLCQAEAEAVNPGFLTRHQLDRPAVTLKLATSLDGMMALADGRSQWITGEQARADSQMLRARHDAILIGRGTLEADDPALTVRLPGLEGRAPRPVVLSASLSSLPAGSKLATDPRALLWPGTPAGLLAHLRDEGALQVMLEGGPRLAADFLAADLVDRIYWYRAPILLGAGRGLPVALADDLAAAHGRWWLRDSRTLGADRLDVYVRTRKG